MPLVSGGPSLNLDNRGGSMSSVVGSVHGFWRGGIVPVGAAGNDILAAEVASRETEVVRANGVVRRDDVVEVAGNAAVETDAVARGAAQVTTEETEAGVELLKHDCLCFNLADLLGDDPLGHLLENEEALLDDDDALAVANNFLILLDYGLAGEVTDEVIGAVEVIETRERSKPSVVVERESTSDKALAYGKRLSSNTGDEGGGEGDFNKLGEHFERVM